MCHDGLVAKRQCRSSIILPIRIDLVFLCDWLPPEFGAVGQYALQYARERASGGEDVVLYGLTSGDSWVEEHSIGGD
jgi:hypothetical protein